MVGDHQRVRRLLATSGLPSVAANARLAAILGRACYALAELDEAEAALAAAVAQRGDDGNSWYQLGLVRQDLGRPGDAVPAYETALRLQPQFHQAAFNLGVARQESGDLDGALAAYRQAVKLEPASRMRVIQALTSGSTGYLWLRPDSAAGFLDAG